MENRDAKAACFPDCLPEENGRPAFAGRVYLALVLTTEGRREGGSGCRYDSRVMGHGEPRSYLCLEDSSGENIERPELAAASTADPSCRNGRSVGGSRQLRSRQDNANHRIAVAPELPLVSLSVAQRHAGYSRKITSQNPA